MPLDEFFLKPQIGYLLQDVIQTSAPARHVYRFNFAMAVIHG
jgi:hypothetical protein